MSTFQLLAVLVIINCALQLVEKNFSFENFSCIVYFRLDQT